MALRDELAGAVVVLRLRTPTVIRPDDRRGIEPWLATNLPLLTGHLGLLAEQAGAGRDVVADYATNASTRTRRASCSGLAPSGSLRRWSSPLAELEALARPWGGAGFDVLAYGERRG